MEVVVVLENGVMSNGGWVLWMEYKIVRSQMWNNPIGVETSTKH